MILSYDQIDDDFCKAKYGDFEVIMMIKNGYMNATKLCISGDKRYKDWFRNKENKELINYFEKDNNMKQTIHINKGGEKHNINGTYVHPDLVPHIGSWISLKFASKVSKIVNNFILKEKENEITRLKTYNNKLTIDNNMKTDKIDDLTKKLDDSEKRAEERHKETCKKHDAILAEIRRKYDEQTERLEAQNERLELKNDIINDKLDDQTKKLDVQTEVAVSIARKLHIAVDDRVIKPIDKQQTEICVLIQNFTDEEKSQNKGKFQYKIMRLQERNFKTALKTQVEKFPKAKEIYRIGCTPNSVNLFNHMKKHWNGKKIRTYITSFNLIRKTSIQMVIDLMDECHANRLQVD